MNPSRGSQRLAQIVAESTQGAVAKAIGVSQQTVSDWLRGNMKPRGRNMLRLKDVFGIEPPEWFEGPLPAPAPQPPAPTTPPTPTRTRKPRASKRTLPGPVKARTPKRAPHARAVG